MNRLIGVIKSAFWLSVIMMIDVSFAQPYDKGENFLAQIESLQIASGTFKQKKYFKVLKHPILSQGEVHFEQGVGLLWQTNRPVLSRMLLKNNGLFTDDGINAVKEVKGAGAVASVVMNVIVGNVNVIHQEFNFVSSNKIHCIALKPKDERLATVIDIIELCTAEDGFEGQRNSLEKVVLYERAGNRTEIYLQLNTVDKLPEVVRAQLK